MMLQLFKERLALPRFHLLPHFLRVVVGVSCYFYCLFVCFSSLLLFFGCSLYNYVLIPKYCVLGSGKAMPRGIQGLKNN